LLTLSTDLFLGIFYGDFLSFSVTMSERAAFSRAFLLKELMGFFLTVFFRLF